MNLQPAACSQALTAALVSLNQLANNGCPAGADRSVYGRPLHHKHKKKGCLNVDWSNTINMKTPPWVQAETAFVTISSYI
jgi:hypothetical protein